MTVSVASYRSLLSRPEVRQLIVLGMVARLPHSAAGLVMNYHIINHLGRTYTDAGILTAVFVVCMGISAPWRGRLVDRIGLRRAIIPSIVAQAFTWPLLALLPYIWLFPVAVVGGLLMLPTFSILRKALSVIVIPQQRRSAFALDAVCTEIVFMAGPAAGIWIAAQWGSVAVLIGIGMATTLTGALLWWVNPAMSSEAQSPSTTKDPAHGHWREWVNLEVITILVISVAASIVLSGTDLGVLALVQELSLTEPQYLGLAYVVWCAASAVGGLIYGAQHRTISSTLLVLLLGVATLPLIMVHSYGMLLILLILAGLLCAPVLTATSDALSRLVSEHRRGEAMGWQGTAFTVGGALGAPLAGWAIDVYGAGWGFGVGAVVAIAVGLVSALAVRGYRGRQRRVPETIQENVF